MAWLALRAVIAEACHAHLLLRIRNNRPLEYAFVRLSLPSWADNQALHLIM